MLSREDIKYRLLKVCFTCFHSDGYCDGGEVECNLLSDDVVIFGTCDKWLEDED
jgi:hypothetical protein